MFPKMAHSKEMRPKLLHIVKMVDTNGDGCLNFEEFIKLMSLFRDVQNEEKFEKLKAVVEETGFSPPEVEGFRELFLGRDDGDQTSDARSVGMTFNDVKLLINAVVPLGDRSLNELHEHFSAVHNSERIEHGDTSSHIDGMLDFPDFLILMKRLTDLNFGRINDSAIESMAKQAELEAAARAAGWTASAVNQSGSDSAAEREARRSLQRRKTDSVSRPPTILVKRAATVGRSATKRRLNALTVSFKSAASSVMASSKLAVPTGPR